MEINRVILTKAKLEELSKTERTLLLLLGHASNEINVFTKILLLMRKENVPSKLMMHAEAGQVFIMLRVLIGKLHEAWMLFKTRAQSDKRIAEKCLVHLPPEAKQSLEVLKKHFGTQSPLTRIRNKVAFHYRDDDDLTEKNFRLLPETDPWEFFLSNNPYHTFFLASEMVLAWSMIGLVPGPGSSDEMSDHEAIAKLIQLVASVSTDILKLFVALMAIIISRSIPDVKMVREQVPDGPQASAITIPFFFEDD